MRACAVLQRIILTTRRRLEEKLTPVKRIRGGISDDYAVIIKLN
jgi:hypothetical protein